MSDVVGMLDEIQRKALQDDVLKVRFLATQREASPVSAFCKICREIGYELYEMDVICAGEDFHAAMKRSTNGGGENSPMLEGQDDFYELFLGALGNTVKLYTRQNDKTLFQFERDGRVINHRPYVELHFGDIAPLFLDSYDWFTAQGAKRVAKPEDVKAPIWCSITHNACLPPIEGTVVYCMEVPFDQVMLFDNLKWDYVLNRIYVPKDKADEKAYKQDLRDRGILNGFEFFQGRYANFYPEEKAKIIDSWMRVFDIDSWTDQNVCGNIWEIRKEWVKAIVHPGDPVLRI